MRAMDAEQFLSFERAFRLRFPVVYNDWKTLRKRVPRLPIELAWARDMGIEEVYKWSDGFPVVAGVSSRMRFFAGASLLPLDAVRERSTIFQNGAIPIFSDFAGLHGLLIPNKGGIVYFDDPEAEMDEVPIFDALSSAFAMVTELLEKGWVDHRDGRPLRSSEVAELGCRINPTCRQFWAEWRARWR